MNSTPLTLREALTAATPRLAANPHLQPHAARDAELLLLHTLDIPRSTLLAHPERILTPHQHTAYQALIARRLTLEPIQYITGTQDFYGLTLHVTPAVLIPRPETELLIEAVLQRLPHNQSLRILDIGTGSGAIAIAIAHHLPLAHVTAVDISPAALAVARKNAALHQLEQRITFLQSDLLDNLSTAPDPTHPETLFHAILSNPPYIPDSDRTTLHPQVRDHEPSLALFSGPKGLDIYRRLIPQAHPALLPNGLIALEIGQGQNLAITTLLAAWANLEILPDLQGIPRIALAHKP